jgi:hypothetical protein
MPTFTALAVGVVRKFQPRSQAPGCSQTIRLVAQVEGTITLGPRRGGKNHPEEGRRNYFDHPGGLAHLEAPCVEVHVVKTNLSTAQNRASGFGTAVWGDQSVVAQGGRLPRTAEIVMS